MFLIFKLLFEINSPFDELNSITIPLLKKRIKDSSNVVTLIILSSFFLLLSLLTYYPEDQYFSSRENVEIHNLLGPYGSLISDLILQSFGKNRPAINYYFFPSLFLFLNMAKA